MKRCELCKAKAQMHCASDQASLCWDCDAAVHSANFLVARHSRNLLCDVCQSPTPWSASGGKLRSTISVCEQCAGQEPCDDSGDDESVDMAEVEDNQVVPWSPPPPEESSSSADESVGGENVVASRKRLRKIETADRSCTSSWLNNRTPPHAAADTTGTLSRSKPAPSPKSQSGRVESFGSVILDSLRRLHREDMGSGQEMAEFCDSSGPSI